jgi:DNA-binding transcriptional LysR family regulator
MDLPDLRLFDILSLVTVRRRGTVTGAARELGVAPSQVSKSIARLQRQLRVKLLSRTGRGMVLSQDGLRLVPQLEDLLARVRALSPDGATSAKHLTLAAPSSLIGFLVPVVAESHPSLALRGLEMPLSLINHSLDEHLFELALLSAPVALRPPWTSTAVGELREGLFGRPALVAKLGPGPVPVDRIRTFPLISPISTSNGQFIAAQDDCPLSYAERRVGHQAQTIGLALDLAARTDQLVFGPVLAARASVAARRLVEIRVAGWDVRQPLFLACDGDRVLASVHKSIVHALREGIRRLG